MDNILTFGNCADLCEDCSD